MLLALGLKAGIRAKGIFFGRERFTGGFFSLIHRVTRSEVRDSPRERADLSGKARYSG